MDSSVPVGIGLARGLWADPFLWTWAAAFFAGLAAGQVLRALLRARRKGSGDHRRRSSRFARAIAYLSLGILALAALFVLADKAGLSRLCTGELPILFAWLAFAFVLGSCAGLSPLALGLPLAALLVAALGMLRFGLEGWLPLRSGEASSIEIARLLPYEVGPASFRGHFEMLERDSVPIVQEVGLAASSVGIRVESLELKGPLRLAARLVSSKARAASRVYSWDLGLYRVLGIAASGASDVLLTLDFPGPRHLRVLDLLLPLPEGGQYTNSTARTRSPLGIAEWTRLTGAFKALVLLEPVVFLLDGQNLSTDRPFVR